MSEDELFKRLSLIHSRLAWAGAYSHCGKLVAQLQHMHEEVSLAIQDRVERQAMKARLDLMPDVVEIAEQKKITATDDSKSRAKSRSDIIGRLRRTAAPTTTKDA